MSLATFEKYAKQIKLLVKVVSLLLAGFTAFTGAFSSMYSTAFHPLPAATQPLNTVPVDTEPEAPRITLAEGGVSDYVIIYGAQAGYAERFAAQELADYLYQISGAQIQVATDETARSENEILVGKTNREGVDSYVIDRVALGDDGFRILVFGTSLVIAGGEKRGTLYGVYSFLEEFYGCRFYSKDFELVPAIETLTVKRSVDETQKPAFTMRDSFWDCAQDSVYMAKAKLNAIQVDNPITPVSNEISYIRGLGLSFEGILHGDQYFSEHPEYFFVDKSGNRNPGQLCLTNPDVLRILNEYVCTQAAANPGSEIITLYTNDSDEVCLCPECSAVNAEEQSAAGTLIRVINDIAEDLQVIRPDATFRTLIWQSASTPPVKTALAENVSIQLCTISANMAKPYQYDEAFIEYMDNWAALDCEFNVWDYSTNFTNYSTICPNISNIDDNIRLLYEYGVTGYFMQGNAYANSGEFGELRSYIVSKLLWDPYCDIEAIKTEFLQAYYGAGYENIEAYIAFVEENAQERYDIICDPEKMIVLDERQVAQCDAWWNGAEKAAENEQELLRVQRSRIQLRYYKSMRSLSEFGWLNSLIDKWEAGETLYDDMTRMGVTYISQGRTMKEKEQVLFILPANKWKA